MEVYRYKLEPRRPKYTSPKGRKSHEIKLVNRPEASRDPNGVAEDEEKEIPLNEDYPEVRKDAVSLKTQTSKRHSLGADRFSRFLNLHSLQRAIANLIIVVKEFKRRRNKDQRKIATVVSRVKNTHLIRQPTAKELQ